MASSHPLFFAIVIAGASLAGCRTPPLPEKKPELEVADLAMPADLVVVVDLACDCNARPLQPNCAIPCILI